MQHYRRVSYEDRCQIFAYLGIKKSIVEISERLELHRSTIYRELRRNQSRQGVYDARIANSLAIERRLRFCRRRTKFSDTRVLSIVRRHLQADFSPQQIAGRYKVVSHQTIYNSLRNEHADLAKYLRRYGKRRGRGRTNRRKSVEKPPWYVPIAERPREVALRKKMGHWERDTMYLKNRNMLLICLERKSRYVRIEKLKEPLLESTNKQSIRMMSILGSRPLTITNDNGHEFYGKSMSNVPIFFCDPYSPQQRGSVENVIGLIRQYIPKKTDIEHLTPENLRDIEHRLNHRPRKCLNFRTPHEVMMENIVALAC